MRLFFRRKATSLFYEKTKNDVTLELVVGSGRFLDETGGFRSWRIHLRCPFGSQGEDFMTRLPDEVGRGVT